MRSEVNLLFVYGTLRGDSVHPMAEFLKSTAQYLGEGKVSGKLFHIDWYPGLILEPNSRTLVIGDLYDIPDIQSSFRKLDQYEGIGEGATPYEYRREICDVQWSGQIVKAWVYIYNWSIQGLKEIQSGDFLIG